MSSPADLRTARNQEVPVLLLEEEIVTGANFSFLMERKVGEDEHVPGSLKTPAASVRARMIFGWLASVTRAPATGTPVSVNTSPVRVWP